MTWLHLAVIFLFGLEVNTSEYSPLTKVHPQHELALKWMTRFNWQTEIAKRSPLDADATANILKYFIDYAESHKELVNSSQCLNSLVKFGMDIYEGKEYTYRVLDATGKPESGYMLGNQRWKGRYYECMNVNESAFDGHWCSAFVGQSYGPIQIGLNLGTCFPDTCSPAYLTEKLQPLANKTKMEVSVQCPVQPRQWTSTDILSLVIFLLLVALLLFGSVCDLVITYEQNRKGKSLSVRGDGILAENAYLTQQQQQSVLSQVAVAFSAFKNTGNLLNTNSSPGTIPVLHGLRVISITWVILGHTYILPAMFIENFVDMAKWYVQSFNSQTITNGYFSVDTFFFLSGLLVSYLQLRDMKRRHGKLNIFTFYLHRYLRITPAYALLVLFVVGFYDKLGDGPSWPSSTSSQKDICMKYWWTNMLYINNLHPSSLIDECIAWGWYLANDMQFFVLSPIFLVLLYRCPKVGISSLIVGTVGSSFVTGLLSKHYKEQPQSVGLAQLMEMVIHPNISLLKNNGTSLGEGLPPSFISTETFWNDIYAKPWCRIGPYLIGMLTGYMLHKTKCRIQMKKLAIVLGWVVTAVLNLAVLYGLWAYVSTASPMSLRLAAFYNGVSRPVWAIGIAWITVACACGYGGPINAFLSWKVFIPLSRLTYCTYLIHPMVIFWSAATRELDVNFSNREFALNYVANLVVSFCAAYFLYILVEAPVICLQKVMFTHRKEEIPTMNELNSSLLVDEELEDD